MATSGTPSDDYFVGLFDDRVFESVTDAATALGVSIGAVSYAKRNGGRTAGFFVEAV